MMPREMRSKLDRMKCGNTVITNDRELDAMRDTGDEAYYVVRTLPNPNRCGVLDQYRAWIDPRDIAHKPGPA